MNLNKKILGEGKSIEKVRTHAQVGGGQPKSVRLRTRKEAGLILAIFVRTYYMDEPTVITETK